MESVYRSLAGIDVHKKMLAVVVSSVEQLRERLEAYVGGEEGIGELYYGQVRKNKESLGVISQDEEVKAARSRDS